jgi:DNA-binding GntR family transcriptional regulator
MIALFRPHDVRTIRDEVYDQLREAIIAGDLAPGDRIKEREVASGMRISTTPVKEALRKLEQDGLVVGEPRRGAVVSSLRAALEGLAARLAAAKRTGDDVAGFRRLLGAMAKLLEVNDVAELDSANSELHRLVRAASRNYFIAKFVDSLSPFATSVSSGALTDRREARAGYAEHVAIVKALVDKDSDQAESLMKAHLLRVDRFAVTHSRHSPGNAPAGSP